MSVKVEMFDVGWITSAAGIWRRDDDFERQIRFPIPAYLIETGSERILVDTGLNPAAVADPVAHYGAARRSASSSSSRTQSDRRAARPRRRSRRSC